MKKLSIAFVISVFLPYAAAFAVQVTSLYQADLPVTAQTDEERSKAAKQGLIQVLSKVSGDTSIETNPVVKSSLRKADYYVQEFSYAAPSMHSSHYLLHIRYEKKDIDRIVKRAGLMKWGENRPLVLVWLASLDPEQGAEMVGDDTASELQQTMKRQAKKLGLPLIFPIMDMTDVSQVSVQDVMTLSLPTLMSAAKRYAPDVLLVGYIQHNPDRFQGQLILNDNRWDIALFGNSMESLTTSLMNQVTQTLVKHYMVPPTKKAPQWVKLEVENVVERDDLDSLLSYLKRLAPVKKVRLLQVSSDTVEVAVLMRGSLESFKQNAAIGQHLVFLSEASDNDKLIYQWWH